MRTTKLTPFAKGLIFILIIAIVGGGLYFTGAFKSLSALGKKDPTSPASATASAAPSGGGGKVTTSKDGAMNISLDEWIGWKSIIDANGGLKTKSGSIYDKLGLKLNINVIDDATQSSTALIKGDLNGAGYTVNRYAFLYSKFQEANVPVVMPYITNFSNGGDGIISKADINGIEGLVGKKVAVPRFSEAQTLVWWLMNHSGLNSDQVAQIQKNMVMFDTPDDAAKAFFAGQVDAAATWQPFLSQAQQTTGAKLLFSTKAANNIILDGIVFNKAYYDGHKDQVAKLIEGSLNATDLYTTEFTPIKDTMPLFATETNDTIKAMTGDATLATYADNVKLIGDTAQLLFTDMSNIWKSLGEKASPDAAKAAFDDTALKTLNGKFEAKVQATPKVNEEQRQKAKTQDNISALLKKSITINFQPNSAAFIDAGEASKVLDEFVKTAKIVDGAIIQIEGNIADTGEGDTDAGRKLSEQRAKTVSVYLQQQGVDPSRFVVVGNGIIKPIGDNKTPDGQAKNRRTDIFFKIIE